MRILRIALACVTLYAFFLVFTIPRGLDRFDDWLVAYVVLSAGVGWCILLCFARWERQKIWCLLLSVLLIGALSLSGPYFRLVPWEDPTALMVTLLALYGPVALSLKWILFDVE